MKAILTVGHISLLLDLDSAIAAASILKDAISVRRDYGDIDRYKAEPARITVEMEIVTDREVETWQL